MFSYLLLFNIDYKYFLSYPNFNIWTIPNHVLNVLKPIHSCLVENLSLSRAANLSLRSIDMGDGEINMVITTTVMVSLILNQKILN